MSKSLDQERILDSLKRQQRTAPRIVPAAVTTPAIAPHAPAPVPAKAPAPRPRTAPLPSVSVPVHRSLVTNALAPRSTALEDARKVLRLMESALQDAAQAVVAARADAE